MTAVGRTIRSALRAVLKLFVDDGVYAAVTIAWVTAVITFGSRNGSGHARDGLILALGLDLIFIVSVTLDSRK